MDRKDKAFYLVSRIYEKRNYWPTQVGPSGKGMTGAVSAPIVLVIIFAQ